MIRKVNQKLNEIGNVGTSMLQNNDIRDSQSDIESVGKMIIECLKPSTFLRKVGSLVSD